MGAGKGDQRGQGQEGGGSLEPLGPPPAPPHPRLSPLSSGSRHECPPPPHTRASSAAPPRPQRPRPSQTFLVTAPPPRCRRPNMRSGLLGAQFFPCPSPPPSPDPAPSGRRHRTHALPRDGLRSARHPDASDRCCRHRRRHRHRGTEPVQAPRPLP